MSKAIGRNDSCPCGSGRKAKLCCLVTSRRLLKKPAEMRSAAPATGYSHPKCYAAGFNDCGTVISREHPISQGLLKQIGKDDTTKVAGFKWQEPETFKVVGDSSLASAMLCKRHNEAMSPLDEVAIRLSAFLEKIDDELREGTGPVDGHILFAGEEIERWMLKNIIGLAKAGMVHNEVTEESVELLFSNLPWSEGLGLYVDVEANARLYHQDANWFETKVVGGTNTVCLFTCQMRGLPLSLLFDSRAVGKHSGRYRPDRIIFKANGRSRTVHLSWMNKPPADKEVVLTRQASYDGNPEVWPEWARQG
jgi:hypothetical protein